LNLEPVSRLAKLARARAARARSDWRCVPGVQ
jgi:hypothetical protein